MRRRKIDGHAKSLGSLARRFSQSIVARDAACDDQSLRPVLFCKALHRGSERANYYALKIRRKILYSLRRLFDVCDRLHPLLSYIICDSRLTLCDTELMYTFA